MQCSKVVATGNSIRLMFPNSTSIEVTQSDISTRAPDIAAQLENWLTNWRAEHTVVLDVEDEE